MNGTFRFIPGIVNGAHPGRFYLKLSWMRQPSSNRTRLPNWRFAVLCLTATLIGRIPSIISADGSVSVPFRRIGAAPVVRDRETLAQLKSSHNAETGDLLGRLFRERTIVHLFRRTMQLLVPVFVDRHRLPIRWRQVPTGRRTTARGPHLNFRYWEDQT